MAPEDKPLLWLRGEIHTPPFSKEARLSAGYLLRLLQKGELLSLPHSRPMPSIGPRVHELRISDKNRIWRIIYRIDKDAIVVVEVFAKKTKQTPLKVLEVAQRRLRTYDQLVGGQRDE